MKRELKSVIVPKVKAYSLVHSTTSLSGAIRNFVYYMFRTTLFFRLTFVALSKFLLSI